VLVFSDPEEGVKHGYTFDGWAEEEDSYGPLYLYTGAGPVGDQKLTGANSSLLTHRDKDRELHLFVVAGVVEGTGTKRHRYAGQMVIDPIEPYEERWNTDPQGQERMVYVFRMRPADGTAVTIHESDVTPPAPESVTMLVPVAQAAAAETTATFTNAEVHATDTTSVGPQGPRTVHRREGILRTAFQTYLAGLGHEVGTYQIAIKGERGVLATDLVDVTEQVLYEAKGTSKRQAIREAVGQLLDYQRHIDLPDLRCAVLLPSRPSDDLCAYLEHAGIALVYATGDSFTGHPLP
jgi:hypothetical protein